MTKTIQFRRECMKENAHFVQTHAKFEELEYNQYIYEMGLGWLNMVAVDKPELAKALEKSANYWKWFRNEFHMYESGVLRAHDVVASEKGVPVLLDRILYVDEMNYMFTEPLLDISFAHFLTIFKHGK